MTFSRVLTACFAVGVIARYAYGQCPQDDPTLVPWSPGDQPNLDVVIDGEQLLLTENATLNSIDITNNGRLVINDNGFGGGQITLRVRHIVIQRGGQFIVGSESCPYLGRLDIVLFGRLGDGDEGVPAFGRKFIGVAPGGSIEMHGHPRIAWTQLSSTLFAGQGSPDNITIIDLADNVFDWQIDYPDIVIASSDYDPEHAEVFKTVVCNPCTQNQIRIAGQVQYTHFGEFVDGTDLRAEVGLLSRNVRIIGEVEDACYGAPDACQYFDRDLFGGHTQVLLGFTAAHFSDIELVNMGQQTLGAYPIHFHRAGEAAGAYARRLSIHHTSSRCVTIHATNGLLIEDVVGYDSLGHCFFFEDGNDIGNTLRHNLGLVTRAGALLPSDRNQEMCLGMLDAVWPGYTPVARAECQHVSTFWITHPNNTLEDNHAAGSEEFGFFYVFHREPTGPSEGSLPPYHSERTTLARFHNNTAHSNLRAGLTIDKGVKIDEASEEDGREFLSMQTTARYSPHEQRDLAAPREPARIDYYTSYKNFRGAMARGGDVIMGYSRSDFLPYDVGSHQIIMQSVFNGRSPNFRADGFVTSFPQRGVEFRNGPVEVEDVTFSNYMDDEDRPKSSAFGFYPNSYGQVSAKSSVTRATFVDESRPIWFGEPGGMFDTYERDGDQVQVIYDADGSISGDAGAYLVRPDKDLVSAGCRVEADWAAAVCTGEDFGQLFVYQLTVDMKNMTIEARDGSTTNPFVMDGVLEEPLFDKYIYPSLLAAGRDYNIYWDQVAPPGIIVAPHNYETGNSVGVALCYPPGTTFASLAYDEYDQLAMNSSYSEPLTEGASLADVEADTRGRTYFWDESTNQLYLKVVQELPVDNFNYCSDAGCQGLVIMANINNPIVTDCKTNK